MGKLNLNVRKEMGKYTPPAVVDYGAKYEYTDRNGKVLGTVSYAAKEAIENNKLDSYKPKNDEEKRVIELIKQESYENSPYGKLEQGLKATKEIEATGKKNVYLNDNVFGYDIKKNGNKYVVAPMTLRGFEDRFDYMNSSVYATFDSEKEAEEYAGKLKTANDFKIDSRYNSTAKDNVNDMRLNLAGSYVDSGFEDIKYDYINKNKTAISRQQLLDVQNGSMTLGLNESFLKEMTDDEISIFNYMYKNMGKDAAYKYIDTIKNSLTSRQRNALETTFREMAKEEPIKSSVFSMLMAPTKGLSYIGQVADYVDDGKIDQNAGYNKFSYTSSAIQDEVSKMAEEKWGVVGSKAYQLGMSMGDMLMNSAAGMGNGTLALALMGTGAAADGVISAKDRGLSDNQAIALGTIEGAVEVITEKIGYDKLFKTDILEKGIKKYIFGNMLSNGAEEGTATLANIIADTLISKEKSEWNQDVKKYMKNGNSKGWAIAKAVGEQLLDVGKDTLGGLITGGVLSGGRAGTNYAVSNNLYTNSITDINNTIDKGLSFDENSEAYKNAVTLRQKQNAKNRGETKKGVSNYEINQQNWMNYKEEATNQGKNLAEIKNEVIKTGLESPKNTESYKNAKILSKQKNVSDYDLGKQYLLNVSQINEENTKEIKTKYAPVGASEKIKSFERSLMTEGISDNNIQKIISSAVTLEDSLSAISERGMTLDKVIRANNVLTNTVNNVLKNNGVKNADYWEIYGANLNVLSDNDNLIDDSFMNAYVETYAKGLAEGNSLAYNALAQNTEDVAKTLKDYVLTGYVPESLAGTNIVERAGENLKNVISSVVDSVSSAHRQIYGNETRLSQQADAIRNNDFSSIASGKVNQTINISSAMYNTFKPDAIENIAKIMEAKTGKFNVETFSEKLVEYYQKNRDIGPFRGYFTDGGIAVTRAMDGIVSQAENVQTEAEVNSPDFSLLNEEGVGGTDLSHREDENIDRSEQLIQDYEGVVDEIMTVDDETAKEMAEKRVAVEVLNKTPDVILDNVKEARNLKIIMNYNKLYLAVRKDGVFKGHYHNLGTEIAKKLPEFLETPDAIIQLANGRLNLFSAVKTERGDNGIISVELNSTKDIGGKYEDYNVVVTMFSSDKNYAQNLISGDGVVVKYKREDLSQVNPQLYKWLAIVNDKSSHDNIISQEEAKVNGNGGRSEVYAEKRVNKAEEVKKALGESGIKAYEKVLRIEQNLHSGMSEYEILREFTKSYDDGIKGKKSTKASKLSEQSKAVAERAGKIDRKSAGRNEKARYSLAEEGNASKITPGFVKSEYNALLPLNERISLDKLGKKLGIEIRLVKNQNVVDYEGSYGGRVVEVSIHSENKYMEVVAHEITHRLKELNTKDYENYRKVAVEIVAKESGKSVDDVVSDMQQLYLERSEKIDRIEAMDEIAANYAGKIFGNNDKLIEFLDRLEKGEIGSDLTVQERKSVIRRIIDAIKDFFDKIKGEKFDTTTNAYIDKMKQAVELYEKTFVEAVEIVKEEGTTKDKSILDGKKQYSIKLTKNSERVVVIRDNVLEGIKKTEWIRTIKKELQKFQQGIPISGRYIKVNRVTRNEYTNSKYSKYLRDNNMVRYIDKLNAAGHLDEIIIASGNYINEDLKHERKDNFKEFARGNVLLQIGENKYNAMVVIGITDKNEMVLYDLVNLTPARFEIKKAVNSYGQSVEQIPIRSELTTYDNSIAQSENVVNENSVSKNEQGRKSHMFVGEHAKIRRDYRLSKAKNMENEGLSKEEIFKKTGWFRGAEGRWKFEISDKEMKFVRPDLMTKEDRTRFEEIYKKVMEGNYTEDEYFEFSDLMIKNIQRYALGDIVEHKELFRAYPQLRKISVKFFDSGEYEGTAWYDPENKMIFVNQDKSDTEIAGSLLHEIQHAIQHIEGFTPGASAEYWETRTKEGYEKYDVNSQRKMTPYGIYWNTAGEIEARDTKNRALLSDEQRREKFPDIGDENTVFSNVWELAPYEMSREENLFEPEQKDLDDLEKQIDKWLSGKMKSGEHFELGKTPEVLKAIGAGDLPVIMTQDCLAKITGMKHDISLDIVKNIMRGISDPIMVFKSATVKDAFVALTEFEDRQGRPVIAALHLNRKSGFHEVNRIASVYGRNNVEQFVEKQAELGNLKYVDKNKSQEWLRSRGLQLPKLNTILDSLGQEKSTSRGLQLPKLVQSNPDNNIILQKDDIVNSYNTQMREEVSQEYDGNKTFKEEFENWVNSERPDRKILNVGRTSKALRSIGVKEQRITWDTSKINNSLKKHKYLTYDILKEIPSLLENPIIVMQSKKSDSRITMFGEVYDGDGLPIMAVLELMPLKDKSGVVLDEIKVVSTHSRKNNNPTDITQTQNMIDTSDILYIEPNKKRTDNWFMRTRLQLPFGITNYGSIKSITYPEGNVNSYNTQMREEISQHFNMMSEDVENGDTNFVDYDDGEGYNEDIVKVKFSPNGIKLSSAEKEKFISSVSTEYHYRYKTHRGLQYQSCVYDDKHILYIYEDGGFGKYNVVARIDYVDTDLANKFMEVLNNEEYYNVTKVVDYILKTLKIRRGSYSVYNARTKKRISSRGNGSFSKRQSQPNAGRPDGSGSRISGVERGNESGVADKKQYSLKTGVPGKNMLDLLKESGRVESGENSSRDLSTEKKITLEQLYREQNRNIVQYIKDEYGRTEKFTPKAEDIKKAANRLGKGYIGEKNLTQELVELYKKIKGAISYAEKAGVTDEQRTRMWEGVDEDIRDLAMDIVMNHQERCDENWKMIKEIRDYMRGRTIKVSPENKGDFESQGGLETFRKHNMGRFYISQTKGESIETLYPEMRGLFGNLLPDISNPSDQLIAISELYDDMAVTFDNPYDADIEEAAEHMYYEIRTELEINVGKVGKDAKSQRIEKLYNILQAERQKRYNALKRVKERQDKKLRELAAKKKTETERKADINARQRLLAVSKRLDSLAKKSEPEQQAEIKKLIGHLDLAAVSITKRKLENLEVLKGVYEEMKLNPDFVEDKHIEKMLKRLEKKQISDLELHEVQTLTDVLLGIEHKIRTDGRDIETADKRRISIQAEEVMRNIENSSGSAAMGMGKVADDLITGVLSPTREARRITGYVDNDPLYLKMKDIQKGQVDMFDYSMKAEKMFEKFTNDRKFMESITGAKARTYEYTIMEKNSKGKVIGPRKIEITAGMRISLLLHDMNHSNKGHMKVGGVTIPNIDLYKAGKTEEAYARGEKIYLHPTDIKQITKDMTAQEREYTKLVYKYYNEFAKNEINRVSVKLKGYEIAKVKDYYPIETNKDFSKQDFELVNVDGTIEGMGFLKERTEAKNPILLRDVASVLEQSIKMNSKYVGLAIPVRNMSLLLGKSFSKYGEATPEEQMLYGLNYTVEKGYYGSVMDSIAKKWGVNGKEYINKIMKDMQGARKEQGWIEKTVEKIGSRYVKGILSLNPKVAFNQVASIPAAIPEVGFKALTMSIFDWGKVDTDNIAEYTPLQYMRSKGAYDTTIADMTRAKKGPLATIDNAVDKLDMMTWTDTIMTRKLWKAAEYNIRYTRKDIEVGSVDYYEAVAELYTDIMQNTQPNVSMMERPQFLRGDAVTRMIMSFKGEPFKNLNMIYESAGNYRAKVRQLKQLKHSGTATKGEVTKAENRLKHASENFAVTALSQVLSTLVFGIEASVFQLLYGKVKDYWDEEEEKVTFESWLVGVLKDSAINSVTQMPFADYVVDVIGALNGGKYYSPYTPPALSSIDAATKSIPSFVSAVQDLASGKMNLQQFGFKANDVLEDVATFLGVPYENVVKNIKPIIKAVAKTVSPSEYMGEYAALKLDGAIDKKNKNDKGEITEKGSAEAYDILYKAMENGDKESYDTIIKDLVDRGVSYSDIENAMKSRAKKDENFNIDKSLGIYAGVENKSKSEPYERYIDEATELGIDEDVLKYVVETANSKKKYKERKKDAEEYINKKGLDFGCKEFLMNIVADSYSVNDLSKDQYFNYAQTRASFFEKVNGEIESEGKSEREINKVYNRASTLAEEYALSEASGGEYEMRAEWMGVAIDAENILGITTGDFLDKYEKYRKATYSKKSVVTHEVGYDVNEYLEFRDLTKDLTSDRDSDGDIIEGKSKQDKVINVLSSMDVSNEVKAYLYSTEYKSNKNNPWSAYLKVNYTEYIEEN